LLCCVQPVHIVVYCVFSWYALYCVQPVHIAVLCSTGTHCRVLCVQLVHVVLCSAGTCCCVLCVFIQWQNNKTQAVADFCCRSPVHNVLSLFILRKHPSLLLVISCIICARADVGLIFAAYHVNISHIFEPIWFRLHDSCYWYEAGEIYQNEKQRQYICSGVVCAMLQSIRLTTIQRGLRNTGSASCDWTPTTTCMINHWRCTAIGWTFAGRVAYILRRLQQIVGCMDTSHWRQCCFKTNLPGTFIYLSSALVTVSYYL